MAIPSTDRKQVIPPHFISYLEKHRIYELFYDMASSLAMTMPTDHVLYLRNYLVDVGANRDKARIMIIGPPHIDKQSLAKALGYLLKLPVISICDITKGDLKYLDNADLMAAKFKEFLYTHELEDEGWILYDFPRNRNEVSALQKLGVRPTHAFQLIPSPENIAERELWNEKFVGRPIKELMKYMKEYRHRLTGLRPSLKNVLKEVPMHGRSLETLARNLAILGRQSNHPGGPMLPRVVIIGTRGSFKRTIACKMAESMGIVHVNMDELIAQALQKETKLGQQLRELADRNVRLYGKLVVAVLEDRLLDYDCLNKGWVLTGFPRDKKDLAILDLFDTPPNRVIFITNNSLEALERVTNRRINVHTGVYKHKDEIDEMEDIVLSSQFVIHPDDELTKVMKEQKEFDENIQGMLDYCKGNCIVVDGTGGLEAVMQRIFKSTLQASAPGEIRKIDVDELISRKEEVQLEEKFKDLQQKELKPEKSSFQSPGKSKSNLKVNFDSMKFNRPDSPLLATVEEEAAKSDSNQPACFKTSISGSSKTEISSPNVLKPSEKLDKYSSCTSIFPGEIQAEWGKVRNKVKSYMTLPFVEKNKKL
ncbi:hypothetical protein GE061_018955 [Apolygus lucorum]|uniref:Adenylate kinase 8 n=1 Tax=Apolygus lucorum TaxID=248454 RepID=A0A6A4JSG3_APOLU|nr:hypothetical protein GE061_018955 [Apolygus lucorum]